MKYEINKNEAFNSLEITFDGKPSEEVRNALKALKFRWHGVKKVWYGYAEEETVRTAIETPSADAPKTPVKAVKAEKVNKYGVKVGDVFTASWGYDQTNVDWFQVVELIGESSVRVVEVSPVVVSRKDGFLCGNYTYKLTAEPMHRKEWSVHLKDNKNGDIKRIQKSGETVFFKMSSYANAYKCEHGEKEVYESSYA